MEQFLLSVDNVSAYREGHVMNQMVGITCCSAECAEIEIFSYIEVILKDGGRHYFYSDEEAFRHFEEDFHQRRMGSFHEFFTTETVAEEVRGEFTFKYYVRRPYTDYTHCDNLDEIRNILTPCRKLPDRYTNFHQYDRKIDYHEE